MKPTDALYEVEAVMNKKDLVDAVYETLRDYANWNPGREAPRCDTVQRVIDVFLMEIKEAIADECIVRIAGFGTFDARPVAAQTKRAPGREAVSVPAHVRVRFRAAKRFRDAANNEW